MEITVPQNGFKINDITHQIWDSESIGKDDLIVEVFETENYFEDLKKYWQDLTDRADTRIYMSFEWMWSWWQHFGKNKDRSLFIISLWDGTKLVGLAPFYKGRSTFGKLTLETRMQIIGSGGSKNEKLGYLDDYCISGSLDIIVDPSYVETVAGRLADILNFSFTGADIITFHQVNDESFIRKYLFPKLKMNFENIKIEQTDICPYNDMNRYEYQEGNINVQKSTGKAYLSRVDEAPGLDQDYEIKDVSHNWEIIEEEIDNFIEIRQRSQWKQRRLSNIFFDDRTKSFFIDFIKYAFENRWLWFKRAKEKNGIAVSCMILRYHNCYYDLFSNVSELSSLSKSHPAIGLFIDLLKDGIDNGIYRVELLGKEGYNEGFVSGHFKNGKLTLPLKKREFNIPFLLNRLMAVIYKYYYRERRLLGM